MQQRNVNICYGNKIQNFSRLVTDEKFVSTYIYIKKKQQNKKIEPVILMVHFFKLFHRPAYTLLQLCLFAQFCLARDIHFNSASVD